MRNWFYRCGGAVVCLAIGWLTGRQHGAGGNISQAMLNPQSAARSSASERNDDNAARQKRAFQPLRDKRGFLALEDLPTEEQRIMALYRALDDATPENIKQLVDQFLAMTSGESNRLLQLTGSINFGVSLM